MSDHSNLLSDHVELCNISLGSDVSCTFTGCTNGAKVGRVICYDYIDKEDEVTINGSCFEGVLRRHTTHMFVMNML